MTTPGQATGNTATDGATVGIQANEVHSSTVYQILPDASPEEKYKVGIAYLRDGVPSRARELIEEARALGHDGAEVRFHWVLALLSKRSYRDLTTEEREQLANIPRTYEELPVNEWTPSLKAVCALLVCLSDTASDPGPALRDLTGLPAPQREMIVRHLDLVLTGSLRDSFWAEIRQNAEEAQFDLDRGNRVWAYFQPKPIRPRARPPAPTTTTAGDHIRATINTLAGGLAVGYLGKTVILAARPLPILAYFLALAAACVAARNGLRWHYRSERLTAKERQFRGREYGPPTLEAGFARSVDRAFQHYFHKYAPKEAERKSWVTEIAGFQRSLRNEIVDLYRESRIPVGRVHWLIRFTTREVRSKWQKGTLFEYREQYRVSTATKVSCSLSNILLVACTAYVFSAAIEVDLLPNAAAGLVAVAGALGAVPKWSRVFSERQRIKEEWLEHDEVLSAREAEYDRWVDKLDSTRPSETEMEDWLTADKTMVLDSALKHYRLAWRDVLTHAFLQTPGNNCKRARVPDGPLRYSKYDIRLFLITQDGVREISTEMDFEHARRNGQERNNFRFDAVSSVHVASTTELSYTLELTLMNGDPRNIRVTDPNRDRAAPGESPRSLARMSLDAAGFAHTLHILEGIAAEGKRWIERDPYVNDHAVAGLASGAAHPETGRSWSTPTAP
ncbi:hypothetical protein [Amycolatopsis magusensis]|uniref:SMODS and SLOG-associating 2TM effector domain-containing protein n=1 Tax=Amycolatopsis magusensis TaxID=882444 RepID=A0ABS4Q5D5_9PSEU|nr:hypothetical protein [Amycolatopsis magusensis]MBP2186888.1 hypothetical protein [Amycolatopsis magusensis]